MKVLFVGEGNNDIGKRSWPIGFARAQGVVSILARKIVPEIHHDSISVSRGQLDRLDRRKPAGLQHKVTAAVQLARREGCAATVFTHDQDRNDAVRSSLAAGRDEIQQELPDHKVVIGVAVESIEAWTLGARSGLKAVLQVSDADLDAIYRPSRVETYFNSSDKPEHQAHKLLEQVAQLGHSSAGTEFRERVAAETDIDELKRNCPQGFKAFAEKLEQALRSGHQKMEP